MAPRAGEAMQTPSSGSSVQGEVSKPKGGAPSHHSSRTRGGGVGGSGLAASEQWGSWAGGGSPRRWRGSRNRPRVGCELDRRPGAGEGLPDPTPDTDAADDQGLSPTPGALGSSSVLVRAEKDSLTHPFTKSSSKPLLCCCGLG